MNQEMIFIPKEPVVEGFYTLARKIAAIRLERGTGHEFERAKLGTILQLPAGSNVELCGDGFNPRTVKVRHQNSYYFVFQEDLLR